MTTQVKVSVPAGAGWDALVETHDLYNEEKTVQTTVVLPGEEYSGHVTSTRHLVIKERARKPA